MLTDYYSSNFFFVCLFDLIHSFDFIVVVIVKFSMYISYGIERNKQTPKTKKKHGKPTREDQFKLVVKTQ